jgi:hypothetical protein
MDSNREVLGGVTGTDTGSQESNWRSAWSSAPDSQYHAASLRVATYTRSSVAISAAKHVNNTSEGG